MTDITPSETASIEFRYDSEYRQKAREGEPNEWIAVSIAVDETYIYGDPDGGVTGSACEIVHQFLESIEATVADERYVVEFEFGPTWLVVEPSNGDAVNVSSCSVPQGRHDPSERLDIDMSRPITKQGWIDSVIDAAEDFHDTVVDIGPDLYDHSVMVQVREDIAHAKDLTEAEDE